MDQNWHKHQDRVDRSIEGKEESKEPRGIVLEVEASWREKMQSLVFQLTRELSEETYELGWHVPAPSASSGVSEAAEGDIQPACFAEMKPSSGSCTLEKTDRPFKRLASAPKTIRSDKKSILHWIKGIEGCRACDLRTDVTPIVGYPSDRIKHPKDVAVLLICDAPRSMSQSGSDPLTADEMQYLSKWMAGIHLQEQFYLINLVKCQTPQNRAAWPQEIAQCNEHVQQQIAYFQPRAILALGSSAARNLTAKRWQLDALRQKKFSYAAKGSTYPLLVTYAVDEVLRNPKDLRPLVWHDLKNLRDFLLRG